MVIETSPAIGGEGEPAEAWEAKGSETLRLNLASRLPLALVIQRRLGEKSGSPTPIEAVAIRAWPGWAGSADSAPHVGKCSDISLSQTS